MKKIIIVLAAGMFTAGAVAQQGIKAPVQEEVTNMPIPPPPPPPLQVQEKVSFTPPVIVNDKGYAITVLYTKAGNIILLRKKGITQKIRMDVWNAKPLYFENKYGKLPPPPPPAPPAPPMPPTPPPPPVKE